jgi:hypothetical protein
MKKQAQLEKLIAETISDPRWQSVVNRDNRPDGEFVYAARPNLDHDERGRQRADGSKARGKRSSP